MEHKNIVATIYLKDGQAVASMKDFTPVEDVYKLCQLYNDSGIDKIIIFDLSTSDEEHEKNIHTIENINRNIEIKAATLIVSKMLRNYFMPVAFKLFLMPRSLQVLVWQEKRVPDLARIVFLFRSIMLIFYLKINRSSRIHSMKYWC